jgi:hypothetical protein
LPKDAESDHRNPGIVIRNPSNTAIKKKAPSQTASQSSCRHQAGAWRFVGIVLVAM